MISFWAMVLFLIGDSACSFSEMTAKEGFCVTFNLTLYIWQRGYIVWLKDAVWNDTAMDYDGTIVYSLKPDKPNASEFENRVSVGSNGSTWDLMIYELTISNLTLEDSGNYSATFYDIFNPHYPMIRSTISLDVQDSPKDTKAKVVYYDIIKEGQAVTFSCHSKGNPQPTLSWFKLGQGEIAQGGEWKLPNVKIEDAGSYFCQAKNELGTENSTNVILDVTYAPKEVRITASGTLEGIYEGAAVSLTCEVQSSNPSVRSYSWYRDHTALGETGPVLRFPAVRLEDRGSYRCKASNSAGSEDSPEVAITVHYGPRGTKIKASCCQGGVKAGESLTLTCETNARPEPDGYTWFRTITEPGGQRGPGRTEVPVSSNGQSDGRYLRFWQISAGDAGEYMCQAKNIISAQKSTALRVDVLYGPTGLTMSMDSEVRESSLVTIHCSVESFPQSELTLAWDPPSSDRLSDLSRYPKRLQGKSMVQSTRASLAASFIASAEHAGRYTCQAKNSEGSDETAKDLVVHYAPKDVRATANPGGEVNEKTNLDLSCEARSNPGVAAYTWFMLTGRGAEEVGQGPVLTLRNLSEAHTGHYFCRTRNEIGEGNSNVIKVTVRYMPQISGSGSCSRTAAEISCSCESRGNPSPSMEWRVSGLRVTNSTERVIREEQLGNTGLRSSLTMRQSQGDMPTLLCVSTNTLGSSSLQLHLPSPQQHSEIHCGPLFYIIIVGLICLYVLTVGFCIHKNKRLSRRLKGGRDRDTYASLQLPNISPEYDVLQVKNKHQKHTGTTQEENDDYQNPEDGNRPDSGDN